MPTVKSNISDLPEVSGYIFGATIKKMAESKNGVLWTKGAAIRALDGRPLTVPIASRERIHEILSLQFSGVVLRDHKHFDDVNYFLPSLSLAQEIFAGSAWFRSHVGNWPEVFDCDDFAYCLKGWFAFHRFKTADPNETTYSALAAGIIWAGPTDGGDVGDGHVVNVVITSDKGVCFIDASSSHPEVLSANAFDRKARFIII